jgi:hypothetical protein
MAHRAQNSVGPLFLAKQKLRQLRDIGSDPPRLVLGEQLGRRSLPMATQQTARVTITATDMTAAERGFRAIQELIVAAAMIGTIRTRRENLKSAVIAKLRRQLPRILPIDANDPFAIDAANANYPARHQARARGLRRKHKQAECRCKISRQASARIGAAAECAMKQVSSSSIDQGGGKRRRIKKPPRHRHGA